ncbi:MAG: transglutaminase-like domain-containing protein [Patescibacteria group bacterium]
MKNLIDHQNPVVQEAAKKISTNKNTDTEKVEAIFYFVRDQIKYMLLPEMDNIPASEIISKGKGQCNNKNIAFMALCKATGLEARIHFGLIIKNILKGLVSKFIYKTMPRALSHSWIEVKVDGQWKRIDTHILDKPYFDDAKKELARTNWEMGYAIAKQSICDFKLYDNLDPNTPIIPEDHRTFTDPLEYFNSDKYIKPNFFTNLLYKPLMKNINNKLNKIRTN